MSSYKKVSFLGVEFSIVSLEELIDFVLTEHDEYISVFTPNVDHVVRYNYDMEFSALYQTADVKVNDSRILKILSLLAGVNLGGVIPGSDLTQKILENISKSNRVITVIGCTRETINIVKDKYQISAVNHYNPPMGFINSEVEVEKCISFIKNNPASLVFLCVGSPRQEILAIKLKDENIKTVSLSVGASFLFLSGEEVRAPRIMQKFAIEWLFRLIQSPRRLFRRYLIDGVKILPIFIKYILNK